MKQVKGRRQQKKILSYAVLALALLYAGVMLWHTYKPLPEGVSFAGPVHRTDQVELLTDITYSDDSDTDAYQAEQSIFKEVYRMIDEANEFIVLDFFLMDDYYDQDEQFPHIAAAMTNKLAEKKKAHPEMPIVYITDPLNTGYGSYESEWFRELEKAGVRVVYTNLDPLRDSTPIYSGLYRMFFQWFDIGKQGFLPNFMAKDAPKVKLSSYFKMLNIKSNHRKVIVTDQAALVTSSNPHAASGFHGNVALKVQGNIQNDLLEAEEAILQFSGGGELPRVKEVPNEEGPYKVQYVTEKKVLDTLLSDIERAKSGDRIRIGMFYISDQHVVNALIDAANRGVTVQMILDPNENAFGSKKSGLPNRPVVQEMRENSDNKIEVRWYNTVIEQFHTKLVAIQTSDEMYLTNGSSNLTERTLRNYNLESNLRVAAPIDSDLTEDVNAYFDRLWNNEGALYTLNVEEYQSELTLMQRAIYAMQRWLKLTTY